MCELMKDEIIKEVPFNSNYFVSNFGRVFSKNKFTNLTELKYGPNDHGYVRIDFRESGKRFSKSVHRLVAELFIANPENKPEVNHKDGDKQNNKYTNLEWCTRRENLIHAIQNDLRKYNDGVEHYNAKLTELDIIDIYDNYIPNNSEYSIEKFSTKYNVSTSCIKRIIARKTYKSTKVNEKPRIKSGSKLTEYDVVEIRKLFAKGYSKIELQSRFNVSRRTIERIIRRDIWKDV